MTTSYWDKSEVEKQFAGCATLKDVIASLEAQFEGRGEVICEVRVNGVVLDDSDESKFATTSRSAIEDIAINSDKPSDLINSALRSALDFIPDLEASTLDAADQLREANGLNARKRFMDTLDGCQWLVDTLVHVRGAATGIGRPVADSQTWTLAESSITRVVSEVSAAYGKADSVLVADLLEYELTAALGAWREALGGEIANRS